MLEQYWPRARAASSLPALLAAVLTVGVPFCPHCARRINACSPRQAERTDSCCRQRGCRAFTSGRPPAALRVNGGCFRYPDAIRMWNVCRSRPGRRAPDLGDCFRGVQALPRPTSAQAALISAPDNLVRLPESPQNARPRRTAPARCCWWQGCRPEGRVAA